MEEGNHTSTLDISHLIATASKVPSLFHIILRHCGLRSLATAKETVIIVIYRREDCMCLSLYLPSDGTLLAVLRDEVVEIRYVKYF